MREILRRTSSESTRVVMENWTRRARATVYVTRVKARWAEYMLARVRSAAPEKVGEARHLRKLWSPHEKNFEPYQPLRQCLRVIRPISVEIWH